MAAMVARQMRDQNEKTSQNGEHKSSSTFKVIKTDEKSFNIFCCYLLNYTHAQCFALLKLIFLASVGDSNSAAGATEADLQWRGS